MIFVDTSVWIEFFKGKDVGLVSRLRQLLDEDLVGLAAPVWLELLNGATSKELPRLRRVLSALPRFYPVGPEDWTRIEAWVGGSRQRGRRFAVADLVIASVAVRNEGRIWSLDRDFRHMEGLGFVETFDPS